MKITKEMGTPLHDTTITSGDPVALDVRCAPMRLIAPCDDLTRLPKEIVAKRNLEKNAGLPEQARASAGLRVRFKTDSDYIAIHADCLKKNPTGSMSLLATSGFDMYTVENGKHIFAGAFIPSEGEGKSYTESRLFVGEGMKDIIIHFPISAHLTNVYVILREGAELEEGGQYTYETPVVFYGSSIVHGIGAGRPSMSYPAQISRNLDTNFLNFGFGGSALAEEGIMEYLAGYDMSVFVYDYDHNAPSPLYLEESHYKGYRAFRNIQPKTPIIMASRPDFYFTTSIPDNIRRMRAVEATYLRAKAEGDENVYFLDGSKFYPEALRESCTSDGCHPNDLGYHFMAEAFGKIIQELLEA